VFVVVGPFNKHMIKDESLAAYNTIKKAIASWLKDQGVPHYVPALLPSGLYADASHPLGEGYARLAAEILESRTYQEFAQAAVRVARSR
jgi:hypothetical protein